MQQLFRVKPSLATWTWTILSVVNFRKLDVYQAAIRFLPVAAAIAETLPPRYAAMAEQLRRASLSIPLNIAEGSGKRTGPDQRRFYAIARGRAMECAAIIDACYALSLLDQSRAQEADQSTSRSMSVTFPRPTEVAPAPGQSARRMLPNAIRFLWHGRRSRRR